MFEHGLDWVRADFHLHTHKDKEFKYSGEENSFVKGYIDKLLEQEITVGVITNHNKFDEGEYKALRKTGKKNGILILPGVELSVKEGNGIHTLIIFKPNDWLVEGENFIAHFLTEAFAGISNYENRNARCKYDLRNVIEKLNTYDRDYFIIFAHVDQNNGFFVECSEGTMSDIAETGDFANRVLGLQKVRARDSLDKFQKHFGYECACVEGSDPKSIDEIGKGESTYLKIGNLSYDAVKFALMDFNKRISATKPQHNHGYVKSVTFEGGKMDGTTLELSPELNTFIGIRGSGKSSILEVMRYAFGMDPESDGDYKKKLVDVTLGSGGQVIIDVVDKFGKEYEIRRIVGEKLNVIGSDGNDLGISVDAILRNPLYFGQKDLSQGTSFEARLLDKILGEKIRSFVTDASTHYEEMDDAIKHLLSVKTVPDEIVELETQKSNLNHSISIFDERGVAEKLSKQTAFKLDRQKIDNVGKEVESTIEDIKNCIQSIQINGNMFDEYESKYNADEIEKAKTLLNTINENIKTISRIIEDMNTKYGEYKNLLAALDDKIESLKGEFAEIKRQINDPEIDIDAYPKLKTEYQQTKDKISKLTDSLTSKTDFESTYKSALHKRNEMLQQQYKTYEYAVKKINESQPELSVVVKFKGEKDKFKEYLKSDLRGSKISDNKYQMMAEAFSDYAALIEDVLIDGGKLCKSIVTETEYGKLLEKIEEQYAEMLRKETPNSVEIFYHNKPLKQHSLGQRASALVLFILSQKENDVVIIDQPEDDLDNKVIYDEVIKSICSKKSDIQFIFATHNANIPVLGDAEKILVADLIGDNIFIEQGNIDDPKTHDQIVSIMEGGQDAFDKRKKIYSTWR